MNTFNINVKALRHNTNVLLQSSDVPIWAVVKMDGYGLGLGFMAEELYACGIRNFAVTAAEDALFLRSIGIDSPILMLSPLYTPSLIAKLADKDITFCVGSSRAASVLSSACSSARAHICIDTGMGRCGFLPDQYETIRSIYSLPNIKITGIFSHFSCAYGRRGRVMKQFKTFLKTLSCLESDGIDRGMAHIANSPAFFKYPQTHMDAVRIGSAFTGRVAGLDGGVLQPVGKLESFVSDTRILPAGHNVGYGNRTHIRHRTATAVIPIGLCNGIPPRPEKCSDKLYINGTAAKIIGPVGFHHTIADISNIKAEPGSPVSFTVNPLALGLSVKKEYTYD